MDKNPKVHRLSFSRMMRSFTRWLTPGLGIKRWLVVILGGTTLVGLGFAVLILDVYRTAPDTWWLPVISALSLRFLDRTLRGIIFGGIGVFLILFGILGLNRSLLRPFIQPGKDLLDQVTAFRRKGRGPRIVAIGGGTGLSILLRGLKDYTNNLTAIVTVADDGGSSGELRRNMGVLPPGDIRNCLAALSNDEDMMTQLFQYRFSAGAGLHGHTLGNLLITALTDITGSFEEAVAESGKVLAVKGRVLPSTLHDVRLVADVLDQSAKERRVKGESAIPQATGEIKHVWLEPNNPLAYPPALQAILAADLIVVGPGSLFTSILPNLLVPDLADALLVSRALKFYVCNLATQRGETDNFHCGDHINTLARHMNTNPFDIIICNNDYDHPMPKGVSWVTPEDAFLSNHKAYLAGLVEDQNPWRHNSGKLSQVIMDLYMERTGPTNGGEEIDEKYSQKQIV